MKISDPPYTGNEQLDIWLQQLTKELRKFSQVDAAYIEIDSDDDTKEFINFVGEEAADNSKNITTGTPTATTTKHVKIGLGGSEFWVPAKTWT